MRPILYKLLDKIYLSNYEKVIDCKLKINYHIEENLPRMINKFNNVIKEIFRTAYE